jgi:hypothetical protein
VAAFVNNQLLACGCACYAGEGERVSFGKNTVKARNSVESWLGSVESAMVSSLRRLAKHGMASYVEEPRAEWVLQQPAQLVIAVSQAYWCGAVEAALKSGTPVQKLADVHEVRWVLLTWPMMHGCKRELLASTPASFYAAARVDAP